MSGITREEFGAGVRLALIGASGMGALAVLLAVMMGAIWVALALLLILAAAITAWAMVERRGSIRDSHNEDRVTTAPAETDPWPR